MSSRKAIGSVPSWMASRAAASETERGEQAELTFALSSTKPSEAAVPVRLLAACVLALAERIAAIGEGCVRR